MEKTAMQEFLEQLELMINQFEPEFKLGLISAQLTAGLYLSKERQQIEDAWKDGENCGADGHRSYNINAQSKIYYTNKYGKQ